MGGSAPPSPRVAPVPGSPTLSVQLASSPSPSVQIPPPASSSDENCSPSHAPLVDRGRSDHLLFDQIHESRERQGCGRKDWKKVSGTRLASMDADESKRAPTGGDATDTSVAVAGKRGRATVGVADNSDVPLRNQKTPCG